MVKLVRTDLVQEADYTDVRVEPRLRDLAAAPPPASAAGMSSSWTTLGTYTSTT